MTRQKRQTNVLMMITGWFVVALGVFGVVGAIMWIVLGIVLGVPGSWRGWVELIICLLVIFPGLTIVSMSRTWKDPR